MKLLKRKPEGEWCPHGWGIAWVNWNRNEATIAPIPLNVLIAWARALWFAMQYPRAVRFSSSIEAYAKGLEHGREFERRKQA